jgi:hypothetical protein
MGPQLTGWTPFASTVGCPALLPAGMVGFPAALGTALLGASEVEVAGAVLALALMLGVDAAVEVSAAVEVGVAGAAGRAALGPHAVSSTVPAATATATGTRESRRLVTITFPL